MMPLAADDRVVPMDGIHDLGGRQGFGAVAHSPAEPPFHEPWEAVARALMAVVAGAVQASGGEFRHSIERMDPGHYLTSSYYEHWLTAAATLAVEHELVTHAELEARAGGRFPLSGPVLALPVVDAGPDVSAPRFGVGDRVRVREWHPPGHTRCPGYLRGKAGVVVRVDGTHSVPDIEAHGSARRYEPTYSVRFDAAELWRDGQRGASAATGNRSGSSSSRPSRPTLADPTTRAGPPRLRRWSRPYLNDLCHDGTWLGARSTQPLPCSASGAERLRGHLASS
jgi:nitrile hydratase